MFVLDLIYYVSIKTVQLLRKHVSEEGDNSLLADDVEQLLSVMDSPTSLKKFKKLLVLRVGWQAIKTEIKLNSSW